MNTVLMLMLWFVALAYAASVGFRGRATHPDYYGARVSDTVKSTPRLRARANRSVGIWCTVSSMMAVVPIVWIGSDFHRERTTWELAGLAAYVFVIVVVGVTRWRRSRSRTFGRSNNANAAVNCARAASISEVLPARWWSKAR